ncbi:enoyl-CoA hydratase/isomerase family protein [Allonocardiopsis opalescens]|uniref:Enoyl-CoA hydratase/carnithine racemase n=1 Tax=Allonocardiopsis opalescens TaxID=1144618 RepID=A0A2T0Q0H1_9ACTN|nr:enoyl-CoA hydratase/isomerase family protein [Allonocardiopsis opalescens]PRX97289.1 enoyl-CoA hydratase/carnithine racemase [Allonocardiopsis opalescens]
MSGNGADGGELLVERDGQVLTVTFNRPAAHNAMSFAMYDGLYAACERADAEAVPSGGDGGGPGGVRVMVLRGAGDRAFIAGTDIAQFADFTTGADGVAYEKRISEVINRLEAVRVPTVAAVRGYCVGGGLAVAAACDLRIADTTAQFGVPIARTLGNCLSTNTYSLLVHHLGPARALDMLLRARMFDAEEARAAGFAAEVCSPAELDRRVEETVGRLLRHAPLTMWAAKEANRRLRLASLPDGDDIVARAFGSDDFRAGVRAFVAKERPEWTGR